jgi:hypothetical protein
MNTTKHKTPSPKTRKTRKKSSHSPFQRQNTPPQKLQELAMDVFKQKQNAGICNEWGECFILGSNSTHVKRLFQNFNFFTSTNIKSENKIGSSSENATVKQLQWVKNNITLWSIVKTTNDEETDNLIYECIVGKFLNKMTNIFPCFLETYGYANNKMREYHPLFGEHHSTTTTTHKISYRNLERVLLKSLSDSINYSIQIQHLHPTMSWNTYYRKVIRPLKLPPKFKPDDTLDPNIIHTKFYDIIFQIMCPLHFLANEFTHNDLHGENILLYDFLPLNEYIILNYHLENGVLIRFPTTKLAKIIDYGQCFFKDNSENYSSATLIRNLHLNTNKYQFQSVLKQNRSKDLTFIRNCGAFYYFNMKPEKNKEEEYEDDTGNEDAIGNISDLFVVLKKWYMEKTLHMNITDDAGNPLKLKGELHIFPCTRKKMRFIPIKKGNYFTKTS